MFGVPFEEIAPVVERSPEATRQLASRARRRVRGAAPPPDADLKAQWEVVEAFIAAARGGDFDALVAVLDPDVVLRADGGRLTALSQGIQGAETVASQALMWARVDLTMQRALVNGAAGMVTFLHGRPFSIAAITVRNGKISEIDLLSDPDRIAQIDLSILGGG
jgi:RNA polymerase sigma-70 factor, ECF subfamily